MSVSILVQGYVSWERDRNDYLESAARMLARVEYAVRRLDDVRGRIRWFAGVPYEQSGADMPKSYACGFSMETDVGLGGQATTTRGTSKQVALDVARLLREEFCSMPHVRINAEEIHAACIDQAEWETGE